MCWGVSLEEMNNIGGSDQLTTSGEEEEEGEGLLPAGQGSPPCPPVVSSVRLSSEPGTSRNVSLMNIFLLHAYMV